MLEMRQEEVERPLAVMPFETLAATVIRSQVARLKKSRSLRERREIALWLLTKEDCTSSANNNKDCSSCPNFDGKNFNCLCRIVGANPDNVSRKIWYTLTPERRLDVMTDLRDAGCHS